jgi:hypothetical protein
MDEEVALVSGAIGGDCVVARCLLCSGVHCTGTNEGRWWCCEEKLIVPGYREDKRGGDEAYAYPGTIIQGIVEGFSVFVFIVVMDLEIE